MERLYVLLIAGLLGLPCVPGAASASEPVRIEIYKKDRELRVLDGERVVRRFPIAHGKGGNGAKRVRGDNKTPIGSYRITDFKSDSRFFFFMQIDYPNLLDAWYGYGGGRINAAEFKAIATAYRNDEIPPQSTALGGYIGIHGIGEPNDERLEIHRHSNWTEGCVALTNEQISELRRYVTIGTPVIIRE